jgi:hypothetical protein
MTINPNGSFDACEVMAWERVNPPLWWNDAGRYIVADRHLPDGTRQHLVEGHVQAGTVIANAQVFGVLDIPATDFSLTSSHLSK